MATRKQTESKHDNTLLLGLLVVGAAWLAYMANEEDILTPEGKLLTPRLKADRYIVFNKEGFYSAFAGLPQGKIKITNLQVPMVDYAHYKLPELPTLQNRLNEIKAKYGKLILAAESVTKVPFDLIVAMIFIESAGNERAVSSAGAIGLMQVLPDTAVFILALEKIKKRLSEYEEEWLRETLGSRMDCIKKMPNLGTEVRCGGITKNRFVTKEDLFDPGFNILVGSIFLGILLDESKLAEGGYRLDKVVVRYNMGYNAMDKGKKMTGTPNQLVVKLAGEPQAYIKKLVGKYGLLTLV